MSQKEIFLQSEGDAWFARNRRAFADRKWPEGDFILREMLEFLPRDIERRPLKVLEIGCGEGARLDWLQTHRNMECFGVEPSAQAVEVAKSKGIKAQHGTADTLPFENGVFDIVIFGFCLYLCDRSDLFRIAAEADRVLCSPGWLVIMDFFNAIPQERIYRHRPGLKSYKMDYRKLFTWHPSYECITHKVRHHGTQQHTDDSNEWVAVSVLKKIPGGNSE